jgi:hypothetical protein
MSSTPGAMPQPSVVLASTSAKRLADREHRGLLAAEQLARLADRRLGVVDPS